MNVLKPHLRTAVQMLLDRGASQHEIERFTGVTRKTIRRYQRLSNSPGVATGSEAADGQIPPPRPPAPEGATVPAAARVTPSACEPHRAWIEAQVGLGRNAVSIYQDLVEILASFERGEWSPVRNQKGEIARFKAAAATLLKNKRVNIRISSRDLEGLQAKAAEEGVPYQTLMASVLHKFVSGRLVDTQRRITTRSTRTRAKAARAG